jgi:asparagine synthetase B (glutamine-hydrolysing)
MLNSLEVRSPFLDVPVIEFAFRQIPTFLKASPVKRKIILKQLSSRLLPREFDQTRKRGFGIPMHQLILKGSWRAFFEEVLFDPGNLFSRTAVETLYKQHNQGVNYADSLFSLCQFELWRREYKVAL